MKDHLTHDVAAHYGRSSRSHEVRRGDAAHHRLTRCRHAVAELRVAQARLLDISRQITEVTDELAAATAGRAGRV